ncbi:MAG: TIGR03067 domain-containing protein [Gemmataceae bacterium]|nr:TIGR03067 domain-containing protein [Gemmataceae bacterium]
MARIVLSLLAVGLMIAADAPKSDKEALAGGWKVVACELENKLLPDSVFKELLYTFAADGKWKLEGGPGFPKAAGGTFEINPKASPKTIDMTPADGPYKGKTFQGIYQLEGDELKACFAFPGKDRPKTYLTQPESGLVLEFWRRAKK